jgi:hypothetical protein
MVQKARRQSTMSESLFDGETTVYRRPLLLPLLEVAIASVRPGPSPDLNLLLIAADGAAEAFEHRLDRPATAVFGNRPQVRFADGVHAVLMIATSPDETRSEAGRLVAAAVAAGLDVWCGYATAAAGSTAADVVAVAERSLADAHLLAAGAVVG